MLLRLLILALLILSSPSFSDELKIPFQQVPNQPYFATTQLSLDSAEYNTLILEIESKQSGTARLLWSINYDPQFNLPKSIWFTLKKGSHDYYFNIPSQNRHWIGWVKGFLIYPEIDPRNMEIKYAQLRKGDLITNIKSGWEELWGPKGRKIVGSTINTMQSSSLFGRPVFVYIYWSIGLILAALMIRAAKNYFSHKKKPPFDKVLRSLGKDLFITIIIFWFLLEASSLLNDWNTARADSKLIGKSLDEKRTLVNTGDFYPFILFCQKHLPESTKFDFRIPPIYNDIKAKYYLFPMEYQPGAEIMIVYDQQPEKEILNQYYLWRKFRDGAYIMKKR